MNDIKELKEKELKEISGGINTAEQAIKAINLAISNNDPETAKQLYKINKSVLTTQQQNQLISSFAKQFNGSNIESNS